MRRKSSKEKTRRIRQQHYLQDIHRKAKQGHQS